MDADATSTLHKTDVLATYDSSKYIWFQVCPTYSRVVYYVNVNRKELGHKFLIDLCLK